MNTYRKILILVTLLAMLASGCSKQASPPATDTASPNPTATPQPTDSPLPINTVIPTSKTINIPAEYGHPEVLTDVSWVVAHLKDPTVRIVDARNPMEGALYKGGHIPGAVFTDVFNDICCPSKIMPADSFAAVMNKLGISDDTTVVLYDTDGGLWAARLWWALRYYGHEQVKMLNGGLLQWITAGYPLETEASDVIPGVFHSKAQSQWLATIDEVKKAIEDPDIFLLDALPWPNYTGDLNVYARPGHIATALSFPAADTINPVGETIWTPEDISRMLMRLKLDPSKRVITYCGGGYYGAQVTFILYLMGFDDVALYDGSLMEWTGDSSNPMETVP